jgi:hypothetical protein
VKDKELIKIFCKNEGMTILSFPDYENHANKLPQPPKDIDATAQKNGITEVFLRKDGLFLLKAKN